MIRRPVSWLETAPQPGLRGLRSLACTPPHREDLIPGYVALQKADGGTMSPAIGWIGSPPADWVASPPPLGVISVTFTGRIVYRLVGYLS